MLWVRLLLEAAFRLGPPLLYAALGETFAERSGIINIGIEGLMLTGAFLGFIGTFSTGSYLVGLGSAVAGALVLGLAFAFLTITVRANQIVVGAALNIFSLGITGFFFRTSYGGLTTVRAISIETLPLLPIPLLSDIPFLGPVLFQQSLLVYLALLLVPLSFFIIHRTALGLAIQAVGEYPRAADTAGINVYRIRYLCTLIGAVLAGIGGAFLSIAHTGTFIENMTAGRGFIALAVVILGRWNPYGVLIGALTFGASFALQLRLQTAGTQVPYQFLQALPYIVTILAVTAFRSRIAAPKALAVPYTG
ncbi:MAG: ABC transporter permease [Deinococcus sp.]|nr:ABC transporter permease [Deinococcus sp.]